MADEPDVTSSVRVFPEIAMSLLDVVPSVNTMLPMMRLAPSDTVMLEFSSAVKKEVLPVPVAI
jgi:hypothetical protein